MVLTIFLKEHFLFVRYYIFILLITFLFLIFYELRTMDSIILINPNYSILGNLSSSFYLGIPYFIYKYIIQFVAVFLLSLLFLILPLQIYKFIPFLAILLIFIGTIELPIAFSLMDYYMFDLDNFFIQSLGGIFGYCFTLLVDYNHQNSNWWIKLFVHRLSSNAHTISRIVAIIILIFIGLNFSYTHGSKIKNTNSFTFTPIQVEICEYKYENYRTLPIYKTKNKSNTYFTYLNAPVYTPKFAIEHLNKMNITDFSVPSDANSLILNSIELKYVTDVSGNYRLPVWSFCCTDFQDKDKPVTYFIETLAIVQGLN